MSEHTMTPAMARLSDRISQHRRWVESQSERKITVNCTERTILPEQILWCADNDGAAKQWLVNEALPWWFLASFVNRCALIINDFASARGPRSSHWNPLVRLVACLRRFPMCDDELVQGMKVYLAGSAQTEWCKRGLVDVETLSKSEHRFVSMRRG